MDGDITGNNAAYNTPCGIMIDFTTTNFLYVADYSNNVVRVLELDINNGQHLPYSIPTMVEGNQSLPSSDWGRH